VRSGLGYVTIFLTFGTLPWCHVPDTLFGIWVNHRQALYNDSINITPSTRRVTMVQPLWVYNELVYTDYGPPFLTDCTSLCNLSTISRNSRFSCNVAELMHLVIYCINIHSFIHFLLRHKATKKHKNSKYINLKLVHLYTPSTHIICKKTN